MQTNTRERMPAANSTYPKGGVSCYAFTVVVNKPWFSATIPIAIGMVKIPPFLLLQTVSDFCN